MCDVRDVTSPAYSMRVAIYSTRRLSLCAQPDSVQTVVLELCKSLSVDIYVCARANTPNAAYRRVCQNALHRQL